MTIPLKPGVHIQVYRGSSAFSQAKLEAFATRAKSLGVVGLMAHGFIGDLTPKRFDPWAALCAKRGLQASAAFGFGDAGDVATATRWGRFVADIALHPACVATGFDMEGAWEDKAADLTRAHAMLTAYRDRASAAWTFDQPWPMPLPRIHGSPIWWEIAKYFNARFPQFYWNNLRSKYGDDAYEIWRAKYEDAWVWFHANRKAQHPPRFATVQGYHWRDWTVVDALCRYAEGQPLVMWCEAFPDATVELGMRAWVALRDRGFVGPDAVRLFQESAGIRPDGRCGPLTRSALGL